MFGTYQYICYFLITWEPLTGIQSTVKILDQAPFLGDFKPWRRCFKEGKLDLKQFWRRFWSVMFPGAMMACIGCMYTLPGMFARLLTVWKLHSRRYAVLRVPDLQFEQFTIQHKATCPYLFAHVVYFYFSNLSITFFVKREEEASLEHAQFARAHVIGRDSQ